MKPQPDLCYHYRSIMRAQHDDANKTWLGPNTSTRFPSPGSSPNSTAGTVKMSVSEQLLDATSSAASTFVSSGSVSSPSSATLHAGSDASAWTTCEPSASVTTGLLTVGSSRAEPVVIAADQTTGSAHKLESNSAANAQDDEGCCAYSPYSSLMPPVKMILDQLLPVTAVMSDLYCLHLALSSV